MLAVIASYCWGSVNSKSSLACKCKRCSNP